jgi:hypothetical protein
LFAAACGLAVPAQAQDPAPIEIMILGTYHMGNPGRDVVNMEADDVTRPQRQAELRAVVDSLARWQPTRVLVEAERPAPFTLDRYRSFRLEDLATNRNEIAQIGYRLARQLGHQEVYAFDESGGEGEPEYFQFGRIQAWATEHGRGQMIESMLAYFRNSVAEDGRAQSSHNIAQLLLRQNDPERDRRNHALGHYTFLSLGDADNQVGAEFNSYWYMRNAKMFAKIALIAQPGDRVLVLVGAGHRYWLTHFADLTPGFVQVDPRPWLQRAAAATPRP